MRKNKKITLVSNLIQNHVYYYKSSSSSNTRTESKQYVRNNTRQKVKINIQ